MASRMKKKQFLAYLEEPEIQDAHAVDQMQKESLRIPIDLVLLPSSVKRFADDFASMYI